MAKKKNKKADKSGDKKSAEKGTAARTVPEHKLLKKHEGHENHLCELVQKREMDKVAALTKGAKYVCHICGRGAARAKSLCEPVEI